MFKFIKHKFHQFIAKVIAGGNPYTLNNIFTRTTTIYNYDTYTASNNSGVTTGKSGRYNKQYFNSIVNLSKIRDWNATTAIITLLQNNALMNTKIINLQIVIRKGWFGHRGDLSGLSGDIVDLKLVTDIKQFNADWDGPLLMVVKTTKLGKVQYFNILTIGCTSMTVNSWEQVGKENLLSIYSHESDNVKYIEANYHKIHQQAKEFFAAVHSKINHSN